MLRQLLTAPELPDLSRPLAVGQAAPSMDQFQWPQYTAPSSSSVAGTSELFSSSFAMLSDTVPLADQWVDTKPTGMVVGNPYYNPQPHSLSLHDGYQMQNHFMYEQPIDNRYDARGYQTMPHHSHQINGGYQHYPHSSHIIVAPQPIQVQYPHPVASTIPRVPIPHPTHSIPHSIQQPSSHSSLLNNPIHPQLPPQPATQPVAPQPVAASRSQSTMSPDQTSLSSPTLTSSCSASSETPPLNGEGTDVEGSEEERVMCVACRGVYPSRRSLTGHIGRNEKCREIIGEPISQSVAPLNEPTVRTGRNYMDQVASGANPATPATESSIKAGAVTNGQDGLSPICLYCDRFISHYKGNIRRHMNQCAKNSSGLKRPRSDKEKRKDGKRRRHDEVLPILHEGFEPGTLAAWAPSIDGNSQLMSPPPHQMTSSSHSSVSYLPSSSTHTMQQQHQMNHPSHHHQMHQDSHQEQQQVELSQLLLRPKAEMPDRRIPQSHGVSLPTDPSPPATKSSKKDSDPPEDAYICSQCEFVTVYKGNMKRHLNTCHPAPDCKDLKEWDRKLESLKASALGISKEELQQKLTTHKQNSTRGRKPRGKRMESQEEQQTLPMSSQEYSSMHYNNYDMMSYSSM